jgi:hypothetical protein
LPLATRQASSIEALQAGHLARHVGGVAVRAAAAVGRTASA